MGRWLDPQKPWSRLNLDFVSQPGDLKQWLGETDPSGITDLDQLCSNHDRTHKT
jgi:hypothetical protein